MKKLFVYLLPILPLILNAQIISDDLYSSQWNSEFEIKQPRVNPYLLPESEFQKYKQRGQWHTQAYPVEYSVLIPYRGFQKVLSSDFKNPIVRLFQRSVNDKFGIELEREVNII